MSRYKARLRRVCAAAGLGCCVMVVAALAATEPSGSRTSATGWEQLKLRRTTVAGTNVYYEPALEPNLPALERELTKFIETRGRLAGILARRREIIADINRILGETDPNVTKQDELFMQAGGMFSRIELTLFFVTQPTIKDFLRSGGRLPGFRYDRASDSAEYNPRLRVPPGAEPPKTWEFCIPVAKDKEVEASVSSIFGALGWFLGSGAADIAIHEVTEMTLLRRARPGSPYWRWFSDGFANAITCTLVARHMSSAAARDFAAAYDPNRCRDLEQQINLRYWMLGNYSVYASEIPVAAESRIQQARYTYSLLEARRLIDTHGIDCVRRILDRVAAGEDRSDLALMEAIKDVTGEDMARRLLNYQTFTLTEEGIARYEQAFAAATDRKDIEQMFVNQIRLLELRSSAPSNLCLQHFLNASLLLFRMGHEDAAEEAMQNCIRIYSKDTIVQGREAAMSAYVVYALNCEKPRQAEAFADELLKVAPDHVNALVVKMLTSAEDKDMVRAREYAGRIRRLAKEDSAPYQIAAGILATDPNCPSGTPVAAEPNESAGAGRVCPSSGFGSGRRTARLLHRDHVAGTEGHTVFEIAAQRQDRLAGFQVKVNDRELGHEVTAVVEPDAGRRRLIQGNRIGHHRSVIDIRVDRDGADLGKNDYAGGYHHGRLIAVDRTICHGDPDKVDAEKTAQRDNAEGISSHLRAPYERYSGITCRRTIAAGHPRATVPRLRCDSRPIRTRSAEYHCRACR